MFVKALLPATNKQFPLEPLGGLQWLDADRPAPILSQQEENVTEFP